MTSPTKYRVLVHYDSDRSLYVARAPELEHCSAEGGSRAEAIGKVEEEIDAQLHNIRERGGKVPSAIDDEVAAAEGSLGVKVSQSLHRDLLWQARVEGVEVDQLLGEILAAGLETRRARKRPYGGQAQAARPAPSGNQAAPSDDEQPPRREGGGGGGGRRGYGRDNAGGGRYHAIMEDRATFLEYVRGLEQGQGAAGQRGPRRGPPGPGAPSGGGRGPRGGGRGGEGEQP